ncbi:hypothetical protein DRQ25_00790 [Candidatus Fermentibacteria bacterium]|nr:MAG: hypothetical protein DRQ25_00790 [Candidatus Fermentibacteria bacterium]
MFAAIRSKIDATLAAIPEIKQYSSSPKTKISNYPYVFYFPSGFENSYETNQENLKVYRFQMFAIVGTKQTTEASASDVLAGVVDAIITKFDEDWNQGLIDNHRVWMTMDSGDSWEMSEEQDGLEIYAPLSLEFRLLTDV